MTQTTSRLFDEVAKLMTDAAGAAHGARKEVETALRAQAERVLNEFDVVKRDEFEAVQAMAQKAREENERLEARISELEALLVETATDSRSAFTPRPVRHDKPKPSY
jgi:hypothetical protein